MSRSALPAHSPRGDRQAHVDRRVGQGLVALGDLVVGEPGAAAGAVGGDAVVLDQQALVEDLLERPPDALDVARVHRPVGRGHVDPVAHPVGELGERVDVPLDGLPAACVELRDAVALDVGLAREPELLLDGDLDGQAVAVPARAAGDVVTLHGLEAGEDVLEGAGLDVVGARAAVGGRRSLVEHPLRPAGRALQRARRRPCRRPSAGGSPAPWRADRPEGEARRRGRRGWVRSRHPILPDRPNRFRRPSGAGLVAEGLGDAGTPETAPMRSGGR